ncbi:hypothetical protein QUF88_02125 [Bacillus sp. DX1.1]|uniref:hypothetical protein n=1 Tax=Bacillus sp. DX1.1 TaxID=3055866 RepID=UPI0025A29C6D|nr:hypothetical protein [Bacillus sp. DX1.1]MDM5152773.1 hypothetical protein [Bacillus sp. DX1.1]
MQYLKISNTVFFDIDAISVHFYQVNGTSEENFLLTGSIEVVYGDIMFESNRESYTWLSIHLTLLFLDQ